MVPSCRGSTQNWAWGGQSKTSRSHLYPAMNPPWDQQTFLFTQTQWCCCPLNLHFISTSYGWVMFSPSYFVPVIFLIKVSFTFYLFFSKIYLWIYLRCRRCSFDSWVRKIPWRRKWQPTPVFLPGKFHGQRSLVGYHGVARIGHNLVTKPPSVNTSLGSWVCL